MNYFSSQSGTIFRPNTESFIPTTKSDDLHSLYLLEYYWKVGVILWFIYFARNDEKAEEGMKESVTIVTSEVSEDDFGFSH